MIKRIISILLVLLVSVSYPSVFAKAYGGEWCEVYVSVDGNDSNAGTLASPLATLEAAKQKVRAMKQSGNDYSGYVVLVRGGTYNLTKSIELAEEDSGTKDCPVIWRNYEDEKVTITGGINVPGSKFKPVEDKEVLARIVEAKGRDNVLYLDLKELGLKSMPDPFLRGSYGYLAVKERIPQPDCGDIEMLVDGEVMTIARYPNEGYMTINQVLEYSYDNDIPETYSQKYNPIKFTTTDDRMKHWTKAPQDDILMMGLWKFDWADQAIPLHDIDVETKTLTGAWHSTFSLLPDKPFYVYNLLEEIDQPGEYYIDRENMIFYFYPPKDIKKSDIVVSMSEEPLFVLKNASNITLKGFEMIAARNTMVDIQKGENNLIVDCEMSYSAKRAVQITGKNNGIRDSYIHDVDGGVYLQDGDTMTLTDACNYAINCEFERCDRLTKTYKSAISLHGVGNMAMYNDVHDANHLAIEFAGQHTKIMYNDIYDVLQDTWDAGAIYGGMSWIPRGIDIKYNYIHGVDFERGAGNMVYGIYGDGQCCGLNIIGNVFSDFNGGQTIHLNSGWDHIVLNNIFINNNNTDGIDLNLNAAKWALSEATGYPKHQYPNLKNWSSVIDSPQWKEEFPGFFELLSVPDEEKVIPRNNVIANNVAVNTNLCSSVTKDAVEGVDDNNISFNEDPGFVDMENGDFNLKKDSVIFDKLPGFKAVPFSRIGRYDDRAMARVQDAITLSIDSPRCMVNGKQKLIDEENKSIAPFVEDGTTYVPLRFLAEALGATVDFKDGVISIYTSATSLEMKLDSNIATKNGEQLTLTNIPKLVDNRTFVPLRQISELFDKEVYWNEIGFISVSDDPELFDSVNGTDDQIIIYLNEQIKRY